MKEMKKEIKMPGFTAEASVYKSSGRYMMGGKPGGVTKEVVGLAVYEPPINMMEHVDIWEGDWNWNWEFGGDDLGMQVCCCPCWEDDNLDFHCTTCPTSQKCGCLCSGGLAFAYCIL